VGKNEEKSMTIRRPEPTRAWRQAEWIAAMVPWRSLGYQRAGLARYLRRMAREKQVLTAEKQGHVLGIVVFQPDFLLGRFIALLAVRPEAGGQGIGRALAARIEKETFKTRRWLYASSDSAN
jgi:predicted N-acetyltransferase YhbS